MIPLQINGQRHEIDVSPDTPLLWVLRDLLGLTGTKFGCGIAQCGACTVHLDGKPLRSCLLAVGTIGNRKITTIEAIGETPAGARVQATGSSFPKASAAKRLSARKALRSIVNLLVLM